MIGPEEIARRFTYHAPKSQQPERYQQIRMYARDLANRIDRSCPDSREKSTALTKLDEVVMWANAAIARRE